MRQSFSLYLILTLYSMRLIWSIASVNCMRVGCDMSYTLSPFEQATYTCVFMNWMLKENEWKSGSFHVTDDCWDLRLANQCLVSIPFGQPSHWPISTIVASNWCNYALHSRYHDFFFFTVSLIVSLIQSVYNSITFWSEKFKCLRFFYGKFHLDTISHLKHIITVIHWNQVNELK